jgi:hypothetical protein
MKLASLFAFAATCTAVAAESYAVQCSKRAIFESPRRACFLSLKAKKSITLRHYVAQMKLASLFAFAATCTAVAAESYAVQCSKVGLVHSLGFQGSVLKHQALLVRGGKSC